MHDSQAGFSETRRESNAVYFSLFPLCPFCITASIWLRDSSKTFPFFPPTLSLSLSLSLLTAESVQTYEDNAFFQDQTPK